MSEASYDFNTCLTAPFDNGGKFLEAEHDSRVRPLRGKLMASCDGLTGCHISRFAMDVKYLPEVVDLAEVTRHVEQLIEWAADQEGLCPMKGDKTPKATLRRASRQWVTVNFHTALTRFPANLQKETFDWDAFRNQTEELVAQLVDHDGVTGYRLDLFGAGLQLERSITTSDRLEGHLRHVFSQARESNGFFPYLGSNTLNLTFAVE